MLSRRQISTGYAVLVVASVIALYPFVSILLLALNGPGHRSSGFALPSDPSLANFGTAWREGGFGDALRSSAIVTVSVVAVSVVCSVLAGYALALLRLPLAQVIVAVFLLGLVVPYEATIIPIYDTMRSWGLLGTYPSVILPQIGFSVALGVFWMQSYFATMPLSVREAAEIDGAGRFATLRLVLVPIASPAIGSLAALLFLYTWNEFLLNLVLLADNPGARTAPVALSYFAGNTRDSQPSVIAAAAVLVALPVLAVYAVLQRRFMDAMLSGAAKE